MVTLPAARFVIASTRYLHTKADTCRQEVLDFRLGHMLAPRIHVLGKGYLRSLFRNQFRCLFATGDDHGGDGTNADTAAIAGSLPNTKAWVKEMVEKQPHDSVEELATSEEKRAETLLIVGWVDNVLFRNPRSVDSGDSDPNDDTGGGGGVAASPFLVPEVLAMDLESILWIRNTTKLSVVGSALALHATAVAGVGGGVLRADVGDGGVVGRRVEACRVRLVHAMGNRSVGIQDLYERNVGDVVVYLARGESVGQLG